MLLAKQIIYRYLTRNEFKAINNQINSQGGGSQTYIDLPKNCISDDNLNSFFGNGTPVQYGFSWSFNIYSLSLDIAAQSVTISSRRDTSNSIREQNGNNRINILKNIYSGFPDKTYDETTNPICLFIIKDIDNKYWAGWFASVDCQAGWYVSLEMIPLLTRKAGACGYIDLSVSVYFDSSDFKWPFRCSSALLSTASELIRQIKKLDNSKNINNIQSDRNLIEALRTKPFLLLAGISGTGKSQKVKELAFMTCPKNELGSNETTPGNYCLIEVKPNWHDSSELLGYYSNLTKKYQVTDFLRFVYKATKNPGYPFFICLDEMNLAPVEQYFAEYLSVLETRTLVGGEVTTAELLSSESFKGYDLDAGYTDEDREVVEYIQNNGLRLPENLFVVGTVNMDDTTHQFSRKVIDRAFTIEMNGGKLADMFSDENRNSLSYRDAPVSLEVFKPEYVKAAEALDDSAIIPYADAIKKKVPVALDKINAILKDTPFRVSYRVQNELILYAVNILLTRNEENPDIDAIIKEATLVILLEKILPRVQGDDKLLGAGEDSIFKKLQGLLAEDYSHVNELAIYKEVDSKLKEMDTRLANSYFANFF